MVFFMETKLDIRRMEDVRQKCDFLRGFEVGANGTKGGLFLAWKDNCSVSLKSFCSNFINILVEGIDEGVS